MLALRRYVLRRPARLALLSTAASVDFKSLVLGEDEQLLAAPVATQRVLEYLQVEPKDVQRVVVSGEELRPLPYKTLFAPQQVQKLTPLVRWAFDQLTSDSQAAVAVFSVLQPHANMGRGAVWHQYFQRQFFLSGAPLRVYLQAYKSHKDALAVKVQAVAVEEEAGEGEEEDDEEEDADDVKNKQVEARRKPSTNKNNAIAILADNKEYEWLQLWMAAGIVKEFCFRGRFTEAIEAYASLPLSDAARRDLVAILQDYEQYPSLLYLYEVHRAMGSAVQPLDVAVELDALKRVGRVEELDMRFQELPSKEQSRADIQKLMGN